MSPGDGDDGDEPEATLPGIAAHRETLSYSDETVDNSSIEDVPDAESDVGPELQAANDNEPVEDLPATGTENWAAAVTASPSA